MVMEVARHKRGDVREDGFIFRHYYISKGRTYEHGILQGSWKNKELNLKKIRKEERK